MARIRSVKPEFWTDSKIVQLSPLARLLWIGSWNFADDYGCMPADPVQLKLRVLPAEPCDPEALCAELLKAGVVEVRVSVDGEPFWHVTNWESHQRVTNRSEPSFGPPDTWGTPTEESLGIANVPSGWEGMGRDGNGGESRRRATPRTPSNNSDGLWTALEELFGPVTESHRSRRGKIVKGLRALNAAPEDIKRRAAVWPDLFAGSKLTLTDTALEKFWGNLGLLVEADQREVALPDCDICRNRRQVGVTNEGHLVVWDDEDAVTWKPCRCVKGATK